MLEPSELDDLIAHVARSSRLELAEARHLIDDVLAFLDERPEEFVRRRHHSLQRGGLTNDEIFPRLIVEIGRRRFAAPAYTERQLRRIVYG